MKNSTLSRVAKLISGSGLAIINAVENIAPELVMNQAISDVEKAIDDIKQALGKTIGAKHLATRKITSLNHEHETLSANIESAVKANRDDLAEAAIAKQLDIEAQLPILEQSITDYLEEEKELENCIKALIAKKREMQIEMKEFQKSQNNITSENRIDKNNQSPKKAAEKAIHAFDNILERKTGFVNLSSDSSTKYKLQELDNLSQQNRIQERLTLIKNQRIEI